jgi:hypothetical protein
LRATGWHFVQIAKGKTETRAMIEIFIGHLDLSRPP